MSTGYRAIQWGRAKKIYDVILAAAVAAFIIAFVIIGGRMLQPKTVPEVINCIQSCIQCPDISRSFDGRKSARAVSGGNP